METISQLLEWVEAVAFVLGWLPCAGGFGVRDFVGAGAGVCGFALVRLGDGVWLGEAAGPGVVAEGDPVPGVALAVSDGGAEAAPEVPSWQPASARAAARAAPTTAALARREREGLDMRMAEHSSYGTDRARSEPARSRCAAGYALGAVGIG
ncbi:MULTISPECIES: hypothetical protein [unclassified Streptomyces]|uniref:Uncharacterized protein n=1 Tax=Streptomyces sp. NBC_00060 TaxID=2975636 RepID=A0AAU2GU51_9ACTN